MPQLLRILRVKNNLDQKQVALAAGISQAWYSKVERGLVVPNEHIKRQIAAVLDCNVSAIQWAVKETEKPIFEKLHQLTSEDLSLLNDFIDVLIKRRYQNHV